MGTELTIGIPTAGRPEALARCIASVRASVTVPYRIVVLDSLPTSETAAICAGQPDVVHETRPGPIGPSASRRLIAELDDREQLLFLDDDIIVQPGAVEMLIARLDASPGTDIVAGGWEEEGSLESRALVQWFATGETESGPCIVKRFMTVSEARELGLSVIRADAVLATMVVRRRVWERASFDPQYGFFYELFDFFLQCREKGIVIEALPGAIFLHDPLPYAAPTQRQMSPRDSDESRFIEKWGYVPLGRLGMGMAHRAAMTDNDAGGRVNRLRRAAGLEPRTPR